MSKASFARRSQDYGLRAEGRWHTRFAMPPNANAHGFAHQDALQFAAEFGLPATLGLMLLVLALMTRLVHIAWRRARAEPLALVGVLVAGLTLSLAWFPIHAPLTACLLALAVGRSSRIILETESVPT